MFIQKPKVMIKETKVINHREMEILLNNVEKPTFVHLVTNTKVRMNKKGNPYHDQVRKELRSNFYIGSEFIKRVRKTYENEGIEETFEVEGLKGKEHISKVVLKDTKTGDKRYVMCEWFKRSYPKIEYKFEGNSIDRQLFQDYEVKKYESQKQKTENKVNIVTYSFESVVEFRLNKVRYIVQH